MRHTRFSFKIIDDDPVNQVLSELDVVESYEEQEGNNYAIEINSGYDFEELQEALNDKFDTVWFRHNL